MKLSTTKPDNRLEANSEGSNFNLDKTSQALLSTLVGSSCYQAIADDGAKDEDNAGWVLELEPTVQKEWIERIRWIRVVDRLAEQEFCYPEQSGFQTFLRGWQVLLQTGKVDSRSEYSDVLAAIRDRWFSPKGDCTDPDSVTAWGHYVNAIARYHGKGMAIATLEQYEQMLVDLAGSFFQVLPFLSNQHRQCAIHFGVLDQFYNHLRDLQEDAAQGVCYLPTELLNWFNLSRDEILSQSVFHNSNYHAMMQFWLDDYLPTLRRKARRLITSEDLHPSWQVMRDWSVYRYRRIDQVFRECEFDYCQFSSVYWQRVQADLPLMLENVRRSQAGKKMQVRNNSCVDLFGEQIVLLPTSLMQQSSMQHLQRARSPVACAI